jgi:hypothetical protein
VLVPRLSGDYSGECRKGLAHGKGISKGIDTYEGEFRKGLPEGRGVYRWADGTFYEGFWKMGLREGAGKMFYSDSTITGFWKADKYTGKVDIKSYEVLYSLYVARSTFSRSGNTPLQVRVRTTQAGADNTTRSDFSMVYSSGDEFSMGNVNGIQNLTFPVDVKVTYVSWNMLHTVQYHVTFEFRINEPGSWDVNISTN